MTKTTKRFEWELMNDCNTLTTWRVPAPGGWLVCVRSDSGVSTSFVSDTAGTWLKKQTASETALSSDLVTEPKPVQGGLGAPRSDKVVARPAPGIQTTEAELEVFALMQELCAGEGAGEGVGEGAGEDGVEVSGQVNLSYTDTIPFFVVHLGSPARWIARVSFGARSSWIGFNLYPDSARTLQPDANWIAPRYDAARVAIEKPMDVLALKPLLLQSLRERG